METVKTNPATPASPTQPKRENMWVNLGVNILIPVVILKKGAEWLPALPPVGVLFVALAFPVAYFIYDLYRRRKYNFISILGFVSVLLTGGIGLLQLNPIWVAIKEAAIPAIIGIAVVASLRTKYPLVRTFLLNREIMEVDKLEQALEEKGTRGAFDKLLRTCTWLLAGSFLVSAVLNFVLARIIVTTDPAVNPVAFNSELGSLAMWSWPVIVIPCMIVIALALWTLISGIKRLTGLEMEEVFRQPG
jgi:intracellular septation protein A